jgi:hypothetical protein
MANVSLRLRRDVVARELAKDRGGPQTRRNVALMIRDRSHDPAYRIRSGRTHGLRINL